MDMLKIGIIGIVGILIASQLKGSKIEFGVYLALATSVIIFFYAISKLEIIIETIDKINGYIEINNVYITTLIKMIGITYIAEFSSSICKDAGYQAISNQIEVFGKLSILAVSMPILLALLETVNSFL